MFVPLRMMLAAPEGRVLAVSAAGTVALGTGVYSVLEGWSIVDSLYFSVVISRQRLQIEQLVEELALLEAEIREMQAESGTVAAPHVVPGASRERRQVARRCKGCPQNPPRFRQRQVPRA